MLLLSISCGRTSLHFLLVIRKLSIELLHIDYYVLLNDLNIENVSILKYFNMTYIYMYSISVLVYSIPVPLYSAIPTPFIGYFSMKKYQFISFVGVSLCSFLRVTTSLYPSVFRMLPVDGLLPTRITYTKYNTTCLLKYYYCLLSSLYTFIQPSCSIEYNYLLTSFDLWFLLILIIHKENHNPAPGLAFLSPFAPEVRAATLSPRSFSPLFLLIYES